MVVSASRLVKTYETHFLGKQIN